MTYQAKTNWKPDDPVMETDYIRIEQGIADAHQLVKDLANELGGSFVFSGLTFTYTGLTANYAAGTAYVKGQRFSVSAGSIPLNANQGQYIYLDTDGVIKKSTSQAVADGVCPLWYFSTNVTTVLSYTDRRNLLSDSITVDQTQVPSSNTAKWPKFFSFFAYLFKGVTGEADWKTAPVKTIKQLWTDLSNHIADMVSHITAAERTAWNAKETPDGAQAKVNLHANETNVHGATPSATANRIVQRDASGRAKVSDPAAVDDIANKKVVDAVDSKLTTHTGDNAKHITQAERDAWNAKETPSGAQSKVDTHAADNVKHITAAERSSWNAKETPAGAQAKADAVQANLNTHLSAPDPHSQYQLKGTANADVNKTKAVQLQTDTRSLVLTYTGNQLTKVEEMDGATAIKTTNLTYNGDGTLATTQEIAGGTTVTKTLTYTSGKLSGVTKAVV
ncbi:hypothetical protein [Brevibacillus choshinensis]|uniref:Uncharacterized protein n=1 Tax=Brevibacillus choshinensis TaxID=54911 RepID=A0ABX7FYJ4_BRECH|nr:hypothetical protein [Brevibacillus choshinensis]QRG70863.1 hypothetical protein JNE38_05520 [Brevibacillus choshinensis]